MSKKKVQAEWENFTPYKPKELEELLDLPLEELESKDQLSDEEIMMGELPKTFLKTTEWDEEQGRRVLSEMGKGEPESIRSATGFMVQNPNRKPPLHPDIEGEHGKPTAADFYAAMFNRNPVSNECCEDQFREAFMSDLLNLPDYKALHLSTKGNRASSDLAVAELFKKYDEYLKKQEKNLKVMQEPTTGQPVAFEKEEFISLQFAAEALKAAADKVEEYEETCKGWGLEPNTKSQTDMEKIKELFFITQKNPMIREIMKRAGRFRRSAQARQREKVIHGQDDVVGVEIGGDISRILPVELSKLKHPLLKKDMMRRLIDKQCMQRELRGIEFKEKGPIIVCVDESGSMSGDNIHCAKALSLAMVWIAQHQKRECVLYSFSSGTQTSCCFIPKNMQHSQRRAMAEWMEHFYAGGTTLDVPLRIVPEGWDAMAQEGHIKEGKTDMIIITDACVKADSGMVQKFNQWKVRSKCKVITLVLGTKSDDMKPFSDEVHCFQSIAVGTAAVDACFSV